ncbi:hypothetical protein Dsin_027539 [Dipteronia sinensis]|uniref:DNA-directed RNA polymerase n=1 Tax=Dipteronia sinensis TaxID=43782 RepID=A0AAD9ZNP1_9ROSI|nr:hypothetical protein Dsin_027539 [Dipteronia sinensis]
MSTNNAGRSSTGGDGDEEISTKEVWTVVSAFFRSRGIVQNQIDSFNKFYNQTLPEMVTGAVISFRPETRREDNNYCSGLDYLIFHVSGRK